MCAAKLFRAQLWILIKECVEIDSPPLAKGAGDNSVRLSYTHQGSAARWLNVRLSRNQTTEIFCAQTPTHTFIGNHQLSSTRLKSSLIRSRSGDTKEFIHCAVLPPGTVIVQQPEAASDITTPPDCTK